MNARGGGGLPWQLTEEAQVEIADMYKDLRQKEVSE